MFLPVVAMCLIAEPQQCNVFRGVLTEDEETCMVQVMTEGLPSLTNAYQNAYIAGITCLEVDVLDDAASLE